MFTSKRDDMKDRDMIKETHLAAQATEEHKKQFFRNGEATVKLKFRKVLTLWNTLEWCPGHYDTQSFLSCISHTYTESDIVGCISNSNLMALYTEKSQYF